MPDDQCVQNWQWRPSAIEKFTVNLKYILGNIRYLNLVFLLVTFNRYPLVQQIFFLSIVNNRYARKRCERCSKLTVETPEWRQWRLLVSLLLTLNIFHTIFLWFHCWNWTGKCLSAGSFSVSINLWANFNRCGFLNFPPTSWSYNHLHLTGFS